MIVLTHRVFFVHKTVQRLPHASEKHSVRLSVVYILHIRGLPILKAHDRMRITQRTWQLATQTFDPGDSKQTLFSNCSALMMT